MCEIDRDDEHEECTKVHESDSSEDEVSPRNTIGDVPLEWYRDEEHIGYDLSGKKIRKKAKEDKLDSFVNNADDAKSWRKIYDEYNDEEVELTKGEAQLIRRLIEGRAPHADFDPYAPYVDWFKWDGAGHPLSSAPEPKRRFIPSKWESKKIVRYVRAIRNGLIKPDGRSEEAPKFCLLWDDEPCSSDRSRQLSYIPPPKTKFPGHGESYNPSLEYIPTQEEIDSYGLMYDEDRPKFVPRRFTSLRSVPAYGSSVRESFDRCLDLFLCPRVRKKRLNIDPEMLKPKLPSRRDLRPYPHTCSLQYIGHKDAVLSVSAHVSGEYIASGSRDGTARVWDVRTGRCLKAWDVGEPATRVAWNPLPELHILAIAAGSDVIVLDSGLGNPEHHDRIEQLLHIAATPEESGGSAYVTWIRDEALCGIRVRHFKPVASVEWHRKGNYFSTVMPDGRSRAVLVHLLSKKLTRRVSLRAIGIPVCSVFHPSRSVLFVASQRNVYAYDLLDKGKTKKLETGLRQVSSVAVHAAGDNLIVGSKEGKLCWFDTDLSSRPYKVIMCHRKDIRSVAFHGSYPLFASSSDDCTAYVFHGMVYSDLTQNPLIVPLEILRGHAAAADGTGVMDCKFHPQQPWLFTAGADAVIRLYCD